MRYPLFIKPSNRGDGKGIDEKSVVSTEHEMREKIDAIHTELRSDALVEEYLPGREFSVAVMINPATMQLHAMPVEIITELDARGHSYLGELVKTANTEQVIAVEDKSIKTALCDLAIGAFVALGAQDYGRVDIRFDTNDKPNFIEANLMPGLSDHGYLVRCYKLNNQGTYDDMILSIAQLGIKRSEATLNTGINIGTDSSPATDISSASIALG